MKKLLALFTLILLTTGCLGGGDEEPQGDTENPLYYTYSTSTFSLEVPNDWEVISQFTSDYPENTLVAFRNNLKEKDFLANVNIVANTLEDDLNNGDYGLEMLQYHEETLIDYKLIEQQEIDIKINGQTTPTYLNYFEGRNNTSSDVLRFVQVYAIDGSIGYIATGSFLPDEDEFAIDNCVHMVKSLAVK